ncbi:MAG: LysR substrate-binding domain-containing protein [Kofleriaceae bacterium]
MELRHLRVAITLAEELHFGRAAARLHCVQSAISVALKGLEAELGTQLFVRTRRDVALTPAGTAFVAHARRVFETLAQAEAAARAATSGESGRLVLRFTLMTALTRVPRAIAEFRRRYPRVDVVIGQGGSTSQLEALRDHRVDIAFVTLMPPLPGLASMTVTEETLIGLLPTTHPLAKRKSLTMQELRDEPRIMLSRAEEPHIFEAYSSYSRQQGIEPQVVLEVDQIESVLAFVAAGLGVSHAPASVRKLQMRGVVGIPMKPRIPSGITALWDDRTLPITGRNFLAVLRELKD